MSDRNRLLEGLSPEERARLAELMRRRRSAGAGGTGLDAGESGPVRLEGDRGPLSFAQERLWFLDRVDPGNPVYNIPERLRLDGELSAAVMARTLRALAARHEVLRTRFVAGGGDGPPVQEIVPTGPSALPVVDLSRLTSKAGGGGPGSAAAEVARISREEARRPFDLAGGRLFRAALLRTHPTDHVLLLTVHHAASDGWSRGLLLRDMATLYGALAGRAPAAGATEEPGADRSERLRYLDWAAWQRRRLDDGGFADDLAWWRERLDGVPQTLELPTDRPRPPVQAFRGHRTDLALPSADDVTAHARRLGTTPFAVLLSAFAALLARWTGRRRFVVGTPVAGRNHPASRELVGLFVNTLPIVLDLRDAAPPDGSFTALVERVHAAAVGAFEHQDLPFERLVEELQPERAADRSPLVQVMFALQNAPAPPLALPGLDVEVVDADPGVSRFDLTLSIAPDDDGFTASFEHDRDLFDRTSVERLARAYRRLLAAALADPRTPWTELPISGPAQRHLLLREWNDTAAPLASPIPVHLQVAERAAEEPEAPAVVWDGGSWSYGELVARADALAERLRGHGVGPERVVAVLTGPGPELVLGALAIHAAGGAYLPLDPTHPRERLAFQLADAGAVVLLLRPEAVAEPPELDGPVLTLTADAAGGGTPAPALPARPPGWDAATPADRLAYLIYTSGSTGRPKAVAVAHAHIASYVTWYRDHYGIRRGDRGAQIAGVGFDASVWEIWGHLTAGASLHLAGAEERLSSRALLTWMERQAITRAFVSTAVAEMMLREPWPAEPALRALLVGGDRLHAPPPPELPIPLINVYGPTEATVVATGGTIPPATRRASGDRPPDIGRPIHRARVYLLDPELRPVPLGAVGEIHLAGAGIARGYRGRPAETAKSYVPDPFASAPGGRLYRTGDLGCHLADGRIAFLGRRDHQLEIRGLRLEPGEIEANLTSHPAVADAVVVPVASAAGGSELAAYVTAATAEPPDGVELADHLRRVLPAWMIPATFTVLEEIPLTANRKIDRAALPAPHRRQEDAIATEPRDETERRVAAVWRELLGVRQVAPDDNFFDLGGHSLLLVRLRDRLADAFGRELRVVDLFRSPTVATQAALLAGGERGAATGPETAGAPRRRPLQDDPIAVVGVACRLPGAPDVRAFWQMLHDGREAAVELDDESLAAAGVDAETLADPLYVRRVPLLDDPDLFDAGFFGVPPREAESMDPQHRVFLECAWQALEDAGHDPGRHPGAVGVWAGSSLNDYLLHLYANPEAAGALGPLQAKVGIDKDFLATRIAYKLGLTGPAVTVQTACSTSLVAVHLACRALAAGECDMALAGGVAIRNLRREGYLHEPGGVLSPDGRCRAFDAAGAGTVGGDGVALVVLRRLADARADGDRILALIRGSALNNDGSLKVGYTAPSPEGQAAVIRAALADAGVEPATIGYVEAHGTGTALGDPVEIAALADALGPEVTTADGRRLIGSVKTNVGHLDAAAGVTGLIKAVLALGHEEIPPSLHFERPNPGLDLDAAGLSVVTRPTPWPRRADGPPRRAGVSSFGIGGTNAHVVIEEAPPLVPESGPEPAAETEPTPAAVEASRPWQLLCLSGRGPEPLEEATRRLAARLGEPDPCATAVEPLSDVAYTLSVGRRAFSHRCAVIAATAGEAAAALAASGEGGAAGRVAATVLTGTAPAEGAVVGFLFPGQGNPVPGATRALHAEEPVFRDTLDRCLELLAPHLAGSAASSSSEGGLRGLLLAPAEEADAATAHLRSTALAQPAIFAVSYALARLWESWGIAPAAMLGHSLGEYVAACLAGVLSLPDALALVALRGRWMERLPAGAMLAVPLSADELVPRLPPEVEIAALNAPDRTVVSGAPDGVDRLEAALREDGVRCRRLETSRAFHSPLVEPLVERWQRRMAEVDLRPPRRPYVSSLTGTWIRAEEAVDPAYWARHLRQPVRFSDALGELARRTPLLLEVGPGRTLSTLARRHPALAGPADHAELPGPRALPSLTGDPPRPARTLAQLWLAGAEVDWDGFWSGRPRRRVALPTYPFERRRYWLEPAGSGSGLARTSPLGSVRESPLPARQPTDRWLHVPAWRPTLPTAPVAATALVEGRTLPAPEPGTCRLVVLPEGGGGALAEEILAGLGDSAERVEALVTMAAADGAEADAPAERLADGSWRIPAASPDAWRQVLTDLAERDRRPEQIVHLGTLGRQEELEPVVEAAFHGPLCLVRALAERFPGEATELVFVTDGLVDVGSGDRVAPGKALLFGPAQVIPWELPHVRCRVLDLPAPRPHGPVDGPRDEPGDARPDLRDAIRRRAREVLAELAAGDDAPCVALRGRRRFVRTFERVAAPAASAAAFRPEGVYLITGGLGGVGLALAAAVARTAEAPRIVLMGRSGFPEPERWPELARGDDRTAERARSLLALTEEGAHVEVIAADVADPEAVDRALDAVLARHGALHGVVHAAGVPGGGVLLRKTRDEAERVLRPKVRGTIALHAALARRGTELDFFVLCSSLNSVLGVFGQVDYVAANAFQDAFAEALADAAPGGLPGVAGPPLSLAWDRWRDVGMARLAMAEETGTGDGPGRRPSGHPLLGERLPDGPGEHAFLARLSADTNWVLDEHRIAGTPVLPGTAYLEMARAAFAAVVDEVAGNAGDEPAPDRAPEPAPDLVKAVEIAEIVFLAPLRVPDGAAREVLTVLRGEDGRYDFEIASRDPAAPTGWRRHAAGKLTTPSGAAPFGEQGEPSWATAAVAFDPVPEAADDDATGPADGENPPPARYGRRWHSLREAGSAAIDGGTVAGARLELADDLATDLEAFALHPALLDVATGFVTALDGAPEAAAQLPFSYHRVVVHRPLPASFESRAVRLSGGGAGEPGAASFRILLHDPVSGPLVSIERYTLRRFGVAADPSGETGLPDLAAAEGPATPAPELDRLLDPSGPSGQLGRAGTAPPTDADDGMSVEEGIEIFHRALAAGPVPRLLVSTSDLAERARRMRSLAPEALLEATAGLASPTPAARHDRPDLATPYVAPRDAAESALAEIWQELLGIERVGVEDDFFELGGDSVLGLRIVARAREAGLELDPGELFERPTVAELAAGARRTEPATQGDAGAVASSPSPSSPSSTIPAGAEPPPDAAEATAETPEPAAGAPSPADFPDAELSDEDLDLLMNRMRSLD